MTNVRRCAVPATGFPVAQQVKNLPARQGIPVQLLGWEDPLEKGKATYSRILGLPRVAQTVKNLPAMQETLVQCLSWEDPLEKGKTTHSNILAWEIPSTEEPGELQSIDSQRVGHD